MAYLVKCQYERTAFASQVLFRYFKPNGEDRWDSSGTCRLDVVRQVREELVKAGKIKR